MTASIPQLLRRLIAISCIVSSYIASSSRQSLLFGKSTRSLSSFCRGTPDIASCHHLHSPKEQVLVEIAQSSTQPDLTYSQEPDLTHDFTNAYLSARQDSEGTTQKLLPRVTTNSAGQPNWIVICRSSRFTFLCGLELTASKAERRV
jgi:hypothetical protein